VTCTYDTVTLANALDAIRRYNRGVYGKSGRTNLEIDRDGKSRFHNGLERRKEKLERQIRWVGKDYGGTAHTIASKELPSRIADTILEDWDAYRSKIIGQPPLIENTMSEAVIRELYRPFIQRLDTKNRTLKNWMTWGTKVWHFVNPEAFQIMDSRAKRFYRISTSKDPVAAYLELEEKAKELLLRYEKWLVDMRAADQGEAWSDLKLWDKVAYELG